MKIFQIYVKIWKNLFWRSPDSEFRSFKAIFCLESFRFATKFGKKSILRLRFPTFLSKTNRSPSTSTRKSYLSKTCPYQTSKIIFYLKNGNLPTDKIAIKNIFSVTKFNTEFFFCIKALSNLFLLLSEMGKTVMYKFADQMLVIPAQF